MEKEICPFCGSELDLVKELPLGWAVDTNYGKICKNPYCPKGKADLVRIKRRGMKDEKENNC